MVGALRQNSPILSVASFRTWLESRPEEEHWELLEGVPMVMTPPNRRHQRIASNLAALLNAALKDHNPALTAYHDIGVNIVSTVPYDPEPDVAVIREDENPDPRYADRFYLVAEILSESDKAIIESKRDIYRAHASCICILLVRQDRAEIIVDNRTAEPTDITGIWPGLLGTGHLPRYTSQLSSRSRSASVPAGLQAADIGDGHDGKCSACQSASRSGLILPSMTNTPGAPSATQALTGSRSVTLRTVTPRAP